MAENDYHLTEEQRQKLADEIAEILWEFARDGRQTGYKELTRCLERRIGISIPYHQGPLRELLAIVARRSHEEHQMLVTAIVVSGQKPARGFFEIAKQLGYKFKIPTKFWSEQRALVAEKAKSL